MLRRSLDSVFYGTVGIIGCGHLGLALAEVLIDHGLSKENLLISYGGSPSTLDRINSAGLLECISENEDICRRSNIIFIAVRPQALKGLMKLSLPKNAILVSCMAGVSSATVERLLGISALRIMPSGPDTIRRRKGIVAVYPPDDNLIDILSRIGLKVYKISDEEIMHAFTVGVCLPAAIIAAENKGVETFEAAKILGRECPDFEGIYQWAKEASNDIPSEERTEYIKGMCTKGGITEAIIDGLNSGDLFLDALKSGLDRSRKISAGTEF